MQIAIKQIVKHITENWEAVTLKLLSIWFFRGRRKPQQHSRTRVPRIMYGMPLNLIASSLAIRVGSLSAHVTSLPAILSAQSTHNTTHKLGVTIQTTLQGCEIN